ncbi:MAG: 30S ribosomal protein S8 [Nanoarchaeota archaeon]|nr:30S ribosomal protein S8 [Nanoarchaeota archaeon]MBU4086572.1 30S ribosomal protein S8 [Nanoarchaeota archaeon]
MSQDIISDTLNQIMNAKRARKSSVIVKRHSNLLLGVLEIAKSRGYIESYKVDGRNLEINFKLNECKAIKPRFTVQVKEIDKYVRRYLPARNFGMIIVSTSSGLVSHEEASEKKIGGSLIAYFY